MAKREVKSAATEFIHAFGNHLQTLSLVCDALRRDLPRSREVELLFATVDQMMELTSAEIARNVHAHPTLSEALMEAAHAVEGHSINI